MSKNKKSLEATSKEERTWTQLLRIWIADLISTVHRNTDFQGEIGTWRGMGEGTEFYGGMDLLRSEE